MARRYGGKFSPEPTSGTGTAPVPGLRRSRVGFRANLLFFVPLPLAVRAFALDAGGMALTLSGLGLLLLAAWLTREGERAHEAWDARRVARRPAFPRKAAGSVVTGLGLVLASWPDAQGLVGPALIGIAGAALHFLAFGPDPMRDKGMEGIDTHQQDRVARAVAEAERHLGAMGDAIRRAGDRRLEARIERFQAQARQMFRTVEEDPRDLTAARKYLGVYLLGARDATTKFADLYARGRDAKVRSDYESLLDDLERGFAAQTDALLHDNRSDLDVEISVLRERLEREGIRAE